MVLLDGTFGVALRRHDGHQLVHHLVVEFLVRLELLLKLLHLVAAAGDGIILSLKGDPELVVGVDLSLHRNVRLLRLFLLSPGLNLSINRRLSRGLLLAASHWLRCVNHVCLILLRLGR